MKKVLYFSATILLLFSLVILSLAINPQKAKALSWQQVNDDGFGAAANWGNLVLDNIGDYIYAGVGNNSGSQLWRSSDGTTWNSVNGNGFGDANNDYIGDIEYFNGYIYASTVKQDVPADLSAEIWRSPTGAAGTWTQVNTDGFGDVKNRGIEAMASFNGYLYAGTCYNSTTGTEIWRTSNGTDWSQVGGDGMGGGANNYCTRSMKVFNDYLYFGIGNTATGSWLIRTDNGASFGLIDFSGFGDANNTDISLLESYYGYLYAGTINGATGTEVWRSADGATGWDQLDEDGFGDAANTWSSYHGAIIHGLLLLGTRNETTGGELWGYLGSVAGSGASTAWAPGWGQEGADGFGDVNNYALYAVTFKDRIYVGFSNSVTGVEIWRSEYIGGITLYPAGGSLGSGTVGTAYNYQFVAVGGSLPLSFTYSGSLPPGLSLSSSGLLSGIPTQLGEYCFQVLISDSGTPVLFDDGSYCINVMLAELPETGKNLVKYTNGLLGIK